MKKFARVFIFTAIALFFTNNLFDTFTYSGDILYGFLLIVLGLGIVNYFFPILAGFLSLPSKGIFSIMLATGINFVTLYLFGKLIPQFDLVAGTTPELIIFGYVLPSNSLTEMWALVASAVSFTAIYKGLTWISSSSGTKQK